MGKVLRVDSIEADAFVTKAVADLTDYWVRLRCAIPHATFLDDTDNGTGPLNYALATTGDPWESGTYESGEPIFESSQFWWSYANRGMSGSSEPTEPAYTQGDSGEFHFSNYSNTSTDHVNWSAGLTVAAGDQIHANGRVWIAFVGGVTGGSVPNWASVTDGYGNTKTDGSVTWGLVGFIEAWVADTEFYVNQPSHGGLPTVWTFPSSPNVLRPGLTSNRTPLSTGGSEPTWTGSVVYDGDIGWTPSGASQTLDVLYLSSPGPDWYTNFFGDTSVIAENDDAYSIVDLHKENGTITEMWVDGVQIMTTSPIGAAFAAQLEYIGRGNTGADNQVTYYDYVLIGTARGLSDIFSDSFEDETFDAWTSTDGDVSIVDDPYFVEPTPPDIPPIDPGLPDPPPPIVLVESPPVAWDRVGEHIFQTGVDHGVLYLHDGTSVPWNGLSSVEEFSDSEIKEFYIDGVKFLGILAPGDFQGKLKAYTYPEEFNEVSGIISPLDPGLLIYDQPSQSFNLSYRSRIGNDLEGTEYGYKIHLLYNVVAKPDAYSYDTFDNSGIQPIAFNWALTGTPVKIRAVRPTVHVSIDSTKTDPEVLAAIEAMLYGTESTPPHFPTFGELAGFFGYVGSLIITEYNDGTWSAYDETGAYITMLDETTFSIDGGDVTYLDEDTYEISSVIVDS